MKTIRITSKSAKETKQIAHQIATHLQAGDVITLTGELGAGKTTFTKGLATGLNITQPVTSPTFTIIKEYKGELPLYHMDVYRLEYSDEDIGFDEYFYGEGVCVIEWAQFIEDYLPETYLAIVIENINEYERNIELRPMGKRYESLVKTLAETALGSF